MCLLRSMEDLHLAELRPEFYSPPNITDYIVSPLEKISTPLLEITNVVSAF